MKRQHGATLLVALIMLMLLTLAAITSFNLGRGNQLVVANQQYRSEAEASAKAVFEEVLSHAYFSDNPAAPLGISNTKTYDVNGDGNIDVTVVVGVPGSVTNPPPCIKSFQILPSSPDDATTAGCASGEQQQFGIDGATTKVTQCADIVWEITAVAQDQATQASVTAIQGVRVREDVNKTVNTANYCL